MPAVPSSRKGKGRAQPERKVEAALPLGKQLAHTAVRDHAVQNLAAFLSRGEVTGESSTYVNLSEAEMAKLWKGLFYCFWMSDKPLIQQALATELASLLLLINPPVSEGTSAEDAEAQRISASLGFLDGFWKAMIREWHGVDRLRMVGICYTSAQRDPVQDRWTYDVSPLFDCTDARYDDPRVPTSVPTHIADIYLEELNKVLALPETPKPCPISLLLNPFILLVTRTPNATVHTRIMDTVLKPLLAAFTLVASPTTATKPKEVYSHIILNGSVDGEAASPQVAKRDLLKAMFQSAADAKANEANRRKVYKVWREEGGDDDDE